MKELVTDIAKALVDDPNQVNVNEIVGHQSTILELYVAKDDVGQVIGKKGLTAQAIRTILHSASAKQKRQMHLEIIE